MAQRKEGKRETTAGPLLGSHKSSSGKFDSQYFLELLEVLILGINIVAFFTYLQCFGTRN